jgi:predicted PurR-regulated permease PerM
MQQLMRRTSVITAIVFSMAILLLACYSLRWILLLACLSVGIGVLLAPPVRYLRAQLHVPKGISAFLFLVLFLALTFGVGYLIYLVAVDNIEPFVRQLPRTLDAGRDQLANILRKFPSLSDAIRNLKIGEIAQKSGGAIIRGLEMGIGFFSLLIYVLASSLYLATSLTRYEQGLLTLIPVKSQLKAKAVLDRCASALRQWFVAQLIAMASVGACASIGFLIIGLAYWPVLGLLTALLDIIPFVGPTIAAVCAVLITFGEDASKVPWVILNFVIVEHIESNLVVPLVMKGQVELPPFILLTFMLILANWFGILGVLIAPPLLTVLRTVYLMVYVPSINDGEMKAEEQKAA